MKRKQYFLRSARYVLFGLAAIAFPGGAGVCSAGAVVKTSDYNIILLVVDCLRADHLSLYGYNRKTSPNIDAFAGGSAVFRRAATQAPSTQLSFASIFTSRNVSAHGVDSRDKALSDSALTLAEILKIYNYRTAAFLGGLNLNPHFRFNQGFDEYFHINRTDVSFTDTLPPAIKWAREKNAKNEKFFLVVHGNELHAPYFFPASSLYDKGFKVNSRFGSLSGDDAMLFSAYKRKLPLEKTGEIISLSDDDVNHFIARYDEGINYVDGLIGGFLAKLREEKLLDRTIIVLTADHGEGLFDHDFFFHEYNLYEDTLRVPLIIKVPGLAGRDIFRQVQLIDLMPTVLDLAGIAPPADAQGRSLKPLLLGEEPGAGFDRDVFSQNGTGGHAIRSGRWKLIWFPKRTELYDLESDPRELLNLAETEKATAAALKERLFTRLAEDKKDALNEPLPAGSKFAADMKRDAARQREVYKTTPMLIQDSRFKSVNSMRYRVESSQAVLAYLRSPGRETLKAALETCLAGGRKISADPFNDFLTAFCYHERGDSAGEERVLSRYPPELKNTYRYIFYERRAELADAFYFFPAFICRRQRESINARDSLPPGSKCISFGGPITSGKYQSGNKTIERFLCPKCDGLIRLYDKTFPGDRLLRVKNKNSVLPVLRQVAHTLSDRFQADGAEGVSKLLSVFGVGEGEVVGDIGGGIGYLTFPLGDKVGPKGRVYAEDIDEDMIKLISYCVEKGGLKNIEPVLGGPDDIKIPPGILDKAVLSRVYRDLLLDLEDKPGSRESFLDGFFANIHKALKKDGVLAFSDNLDPALGLIPEKVVETLEKRHFRLIADKSDQRERRVLLLFIKSEID